ncbi:hypothetical protein KTO58_10935 [Chitinophaga pendula]|uniref:hypothetical protein n=1 Tax=Chitinophaga TaxID=79328 RepID=UPI000BB04E40|nr:MULTISPECIES: hypothetical protein [Chitinophaga]ASZ12706.1 hypothetical protein CK934_17960 [Chitinophaga sp. MD30]UCJ09679.1 hypothetical protein KTO58_10935 [Chitinophaga pendula]
MRISAYHIKRQLPAIFLLVVLCFVQLVKTGHTHDHAGAQHRSLWSWRQLLAGGGELCVSGEAFVQRGHACIICDYDLSKDAVIDYSLPAVAILSFWFLPYLLFSSSSYTGVHTVRSNRGPPVAMM